MYACFSSGMLGRRVSSEQWAKYTGALRSGRLMCGLAEAEREALEDFEVRDPALIVPAGRLFCPTAGAH